MLRRYEYIVDLVAVLSNPHSSGEGGEFEQGVTLLRLLIYCKCSETLLRCAECESAA